jgi:hypothetical protein
MRTMQREVGKFEVKSGILVVTDPCYGRGTWCMGSLDNVKKGQWEGYALLSDEGEWGKRVAELVIHHTDRALLSEDMDTAEEISVGVDSGQAGFFDDSIYPASKDEQGDYGDLSTFYGRACEATGSACGAGIVDGAGIVSSSGFGDGGYRCWTKRDAAGQVIGAKIVFIGDEEDDEDGYLTDEEYESIGV